MATDKDLFDKGVRDGYDAYAGTGTYDLSLHGNPSYSDGLRSGRTQAADEALIAVELSRRGGDPEIGPTEAAQILGCSVPTVARRIGEGTLPAAVTASGRARIRLSDALLHSSGFERRKPPGGVPVWQQARS